MDRREIDLPAERNVIGLLLREPLQYWETCQELNADAFSDPLLGEMYRLIGELSAKGPVEPAILLPLIREKANGISLPQYLSMLKAEAPEGGHAIDYAPTIQAAHARRRALAAAAKLEGKLARAPDPLAVIIEAHAELSGLLVPGGSSIQSMGQIAWEVAGSAARKAGQASRGLRPRLKAWNEIVGPMFPGDAVILGGLPSMGKSSLGLQVVREIAEEGDPAGAISVEMTKEQLVTREVAREAGIDSERIETGELNEEEAFQVLDGAKKLASIPVYFDSLARATTATLEARVREMIRRYGIKVVMVDHLHKIRSREKTRDSFENLRLAMSEMKAAAVATGIPWLLLARLNRSAYDEKDRRPRIKHLWGGSDIESEADTIVFVHREAYFLQGEEPRDKGSEAYQQWQLKWNEQWDKAEIVFGKRRRGARKGYVECIFEPGLTKFSDKTITPA